jgi:hypothetical protein
LLYLVHTIVVLIEDFLGELDVEVLWGADAVGHFAEVFKIGTGNLHFAREFLHLYKSLDLFVDDLHDVLGDLLSFEVLQKLLDLLLLVVFVG